MIDRLDLRITYMADQNNRQIYRTGTLGQKCSLNIYSVKIFHVEFKREITHNVK